MPREVPRYWARSRPSGRLLGHAAGAARAFAARAPSGDARGCARARSRLRPRRRGARPVLVGGCRRGARVPEPQHSAAARSPTEVVLRRSGDMWALSRRGHDSLLRDSKGIRYLAELIAAAAARSPCSSWPVRASRSRARSARRGGARGLPAAAGRRSRRSSTRRSGSPTRSGGATRRMSGRRCAELAAAVGLGGRPRRTPSSVERARKAVTNRIRDALARIEREDPELGAHLRAQRADGNRVRVPPGAAVALVPARGVATLRAS